MLRVNCGLSRKVSKDFQSTGYSVNFDAEITASVSDPEALVEQVKEVFDLAEAALNAQIERSQSDAAIASRDEEPRATVRQPVAENTRRAPVSNGNGHKDDAATNKQLQYLLSIGKRMKLSTAALEGEIEQILGEQVNLYDLTKKQAGVVIDNLTTTTTAGSRG
jgi:methylmalonyl-CoA mutase N-terminal domain/subunit